MGPNYYTRQQPGDRNCSCDSFTAFYFSTLRNKNRRWFFRTDHVLLVRHDGHLRIFADHSLPSNFCSAQSDLWYSIVDTTSSRFLVTRCGVPLHHGRRSALLRSRSLRKSKYSHQLDICESNIVVELSRAGSMGALTYQ